MGAGSIQIEEEAAVLAAAIDEGGRRMSARRVTEPSRVDDRRRHAAHRAAGLRGPGSPAPTRGATAASSAGSCAKRTPGVSSGGRRTVCVRPSSSARSRSSRSSTPRSRRSRDRTSRETSESRSSRSSPSSPSSASSGSSPSSPSAGIATGTPGCRSSPAARSSPGSSQRSRQAPAACSRSARRASATRSPSSAPRCRKAHSSRTTTLRSTAQGLRDRHLVHTARRAVRAGGRRHADRRFGWRQTTLIFAAPLVIVGSSPCSSCASPSAATWSARRSGRPRASPSARRSRSPSVRRSGRSSLSAPSVASSSRSSSSSAASSSSRSSSVLPRRGVRSRRAGRALVFVGRRHGLVGAFVGGGFVDSLMRTNPGRVLIVSGATIAATGPLIVAGRAEAADRRGLGALCLPASRVR